jgi:hypothetical protein
LAWLTTSACSSCLWIEPGALHASAHASSIHAWRAGAAGVTQQLYGWAVGSVHEYRPARPNPELKRQHRSLYVDAVAQSTSVGS